ncbi:MAG: LEA/WHy family protein [Gemmatimonadaceae bacterium]
MNGNNVVRFAARAARSGRGVLAAVLAVGAITACATLGRSVFKEPVVNFREVRLNGLGLSGGSLDVVLGVYNPNGFRLEATRLTYNLLMDSVQIASGALDDQFAVQSGDSSIVTIPVSFTYAGIGRAGQELLRSGTVNYRVRGDMTVATPLGNFTRPYDQTGRFSPLRGSSRP